MDISWAAEAMSRFGLLGMFLVVALEYACFPLPSEVLLPLAGFTCAAAGVPPVLSVFVSTLAGLSGSFVCYLLGRFGQRFLEKLLKRFPKAKEKLAETRAFSSSFGGLSVMAARVIPLCRTWISFAAGLAAQRISSFLLYSAMGIIIWNTLLLGSGYLLFGAGQRLSSKALELLPLSAAALIVCSLLVRFFLRRRKIRTDP